MNRKGVQQWVVIVIIAMFTILVVFPIFNKIQAATLEEEVVDRCRASVISRAVAKSAVGEDIFRLECDRDQVFFKDEDSNAVNKKVLAEIKQCYHSFGEGRVDFSKSGEIFKENHCAICASFEFLPGYEARTKYVSTTLTPYLDKVPFSKDQKWGEVIRESKVTEKSGMAFSIDESLKGENKYILFFKYSPETRAQWATRRFGGESSSTLPVIVLEEFPKSKSEFQGCEVLLN